MLQRNLVISIIIISFNFFLKINTQHLPLCDSLNHLDGNEDDVQYSERKFRRVRALCNAIYSSRVESDENEMDSIPDFDLSQMHSDQDVNQILKRFRRSRFSSGGGRSSSGGGRFSSGGSRFSSSSRSGSSSSGGSRFFGGSRSSVGASSSGGSSRIFSRSSSSSSSGSGSRIFSRSSGASVAGSGSGTRMFSRSGSPAAPSNSGIRIFSRTPTSSNTGNRVREAVRTMIRKPASPGTGISPGTGGSGVIYGNKPSLSDKIRKITHGTGGGGISGNTFGSGTGGFGGGGGSGGNAWARAGKKFLPVAANFGKRYYQRRKYNKGMYAGAGAGAGYYAGSRMSHQGQHYANNHYYYPPAEDTPPDQIDGKAPTVFYCIQEDLNMTLVNETLNDDGIGVCNISGQLVSCPIEIECKINEADNCCEDEQRTPYCCGGSIPEEYASQYGGYADDIDDAGESIHRMLNVVTVICALLATTCFTMWHQKGQ